MISSIGAALAITNVEATKTFASSSASVATVGINGIARTILTASSSTTGVSAVNTSTQSIVPQYLTIPNFQFQSTNTAAFNPTALVMGIFSTGGSAASIGLANITFSGTAGMIQPYLALGGS